MIFLPNDIEKFVKFAGIDFAYQYHPVMAEQFYLDFGSEKETDQAQSLFDAVTVDDKKALFIRRETETRLFLGCSIFKCLEDNAIIHSNVNSERFYNLFYEAEPLKSGMHHADGMLWIRSPDRHHIVIPNKVPLTR